MSVSENEGKYSCQEEIIGDVQTKKGDNVKTPNTKRSFNVVWVQFSTSLLFSRIPTILPENIFSILVMPKCAMNIIIFAQVMNKVTNKIKSLIINVTNELILIFWILKHLYELRLV